MTHSQVTWLVHTWHDSFTCEVCCYGTLYSTYYFEVTCVTWLFHIWHDSFTCDMTHPYVTWLIHTRHNSFTCEVCCHGICEASTFSIPRYIFHIYTHEDMNTWINNTNMYTCYSADNFEVTRVLRFFHTRHDSFMHNMTQYVRDMTHPFVTSLKMHDVTKWATLLKMTLKMSDVSKWAMSLKMSNVARNERRLKMSDDTQNEQRRICDVALNVAQHKRCLKMSDVLQPPETLLEDGFSTSMPLFCLVCTIISKKTFFLD